jgi:hypothetical protein
MYVDGEGRRSNPIVDDDDESDLLEVLLGFVAHFLERALHGVHGHAVDETIFFAIKQEMTAFCAEGVLLEKAGFNLQAFDEA